MVHRNAWNGGPQITWVNIIATLGLLATVAAGGWLLFQNQFSNLEIQFRQTTSDLSSQIKDDRLQTDRLRDRVVPREEHIEVIKRLDKELDALQKRLDVIETTRPTTGELQSAASSIKDQIGEVKERLRFLEQVPVLRPPKVQESPLPSPTPR